MTDTSSPIAMRPPRIEEGYSTPTRPERGRFLGTARSMAAPALDAARESLEASRGGVGAYAANMPMAVLNLADAAARGGVGAFADLVPGLRPAARRDFAREVLGMGEAAPGSVARVPSALDEGLGGLSEVARRMFQEGPVPDRLMAGVDPTAPRRTVEQMREDARARLAERDLMVARLTEDEAPVRFAGGDLTALVSRSPDREGWRVTVFQPDGSPSGHSDAPDKAAAVRRALEDQFRPVGLDPRTAAPAPRDFGFTRDNPGGDWLQNKQDRADQAMAESSRGLGRRGITGSVTGTMGMDTDMFLPTDRLSGLTGLMDENRVPGDPRFDALLARVREEGFDPNQAGNKIVIAVNHRGEPFVLEGNTRIAVARELGIPNVRAEVRYWNGAEAVEGPFAPNNVARIAAREPAVRPVAPLPAPRNSAEENADEIARLLREGKVDEAEALLDFADDRRLYQRYERGEVGMDVPLDLESRMGRAQDLGFVEDEFIGSMEPGIRSLDPRMARGERRYAGTFSSDNPYLASSYADPRRGSVYPLLTRGLPEDAVRFDAEGQLWNRLPGFAEADIGGRSTGPISVRLANMGESAMRGQYDTNQLSRIAFFEGLPGAEFRNVVDRGPSAPVDPNNPEVLREFQRRGAEPSLVRSRQDTRGVRSRFARFDPRFAGSRNLMAGVGGAGVMVAASDDEEEPAVRGYAQGGEVMMRSDMPQQIHQGVGSLSEVARRMFQGGEVFSSMGNPLEPYQQYLTQTYAQPIQQSAQQAVGQFVDSVRQKEQAYFGGGGMGGGMQSSMQSPMQSPLQGGLMGTPAQGAMAASPFGNSLSLQQQMGQGRMAQNAVPFDASGNAYNMRALTEQLTGQPTPSTFDGNRPGATSDRIMGTRDMLQIRRNLGIV